MTTNLARILCGSALVAAVASGPIAAQSARPFQGPTHLPMQPRYNDDGSFMRGLRGEAVSSNWSGYVDTAGAPYLSASATFQVPSVTSETVPSTEEWATQWVGVGGYGEQTLIQLGAAERTGTDGTAGYFVWYELYPAPLVALSQTANPGDIITASFECTASCSPSSVQTWQLTISDETAGWIWTQSFQYQSSMASAEWITEPPFDAITGEQPLADYVRATYDPVEANGANPNLSLSANGIVAQDPYGETSNPSAPDVFSTCWGKGSLTPCTAGSFTTPPPATTASLSANPKSILEGQLSTLTWSSTHASSCTGGGFTVSGTSGSAVVHSSVTTSYAVTCWGNGQSATAMATVTMRSPRTCQKKHCR